MALSLDDRLLGEKVHYYCSSSDEEREPDEDAASGEEAPVAQEAAEPPAPKAWTGASSNTGPKGVVEDWRRYKQLQNEDRLAQEAEKRALAKKLALTCRTATEDAKEEELDAELAEALAELEDENFIKEYRRRRLDEMRQQLMQLKMFGSVQELQRDTFIAAIDNEPPQVKVLLHIYESRDRACRALNACLDQLAVRYPTVKFCRILASQAHMSRQFVQRGLPAIVVYKSGEVTNSFVNLSKELGDQADTSDLESFLTEYGVLSDQLLCEGRAAQLGTAGSGAAAARRTEDSDSD